MSQCPALDASGHGRRPGRRSLDLKTVDVVGLEVVGTHRRLDALDCSRDYPATMPVPSNTKSRLAGRHQCLEPRRSNLASRRPRSRSSCLSRDSLWTQHSGTIQPEHRPFGQSRRSPSIQPILLSRRPSPAQPNLLRRGLTPALTQADWTEQAASRERSVVGRSRSRGIRTRPALC